MTRRLAVVALALVSALPLGAQRPRHHRAHRYRSRQPRVTYEAPADAAGASARCRDGTLSYSAHRRGTCSHHGGVAAWLGLR